MPHIEEKIDLRVSRTQNALQKALLASLEKIPFSKITVNGICKQATVSRATFYMHYPDKYALLRVCLERIWTEMGSEPTSQKELFRQAVLLTEKYARLFKNLVNEDCSQELARMFGEAMVDGIVKQLQKGMAQGKEYSVPIHILAMFVSGGISHLLLWWIHGGGDISADAMVEYLSALAQVPGDKGGAIGV